jgi:hypothetical protein
MQLGDNNAVSTQLPERVLEEARDKSKAYMLINNRAAIRKLDHYTNVTIYPPPQRPHSNCPRKHGLTRIPSKTSASETQTSLTIHSTSSWFPEDGTKQLSPSIPGTFWFYYVWLTLNLYADLDISRWCWYFMLRVIRLPELTSACNGYSVWLTSSLHADVTPCG